MDASTGPQRRFSSVWPWMVLFVAGFALSAVRPDWMLALSRYRSPSWFESSAAVVGLAAAWMILRGLWLARLAEAAQPSGAGELASRVRALFETVLGRVGVCVLLATFVALTSLSAEGGAESVGQAVGGLDLLGGLFGLAISAPASWLHMRQSFHTLWKYWPGLGFATHAILSVLDFGVAVTIVRIVLHAG